MKTASGSGQVSSPSGARPWRSVWLETPKASRLRRAMATSASFFSIAQT